jgi:hypothetical protein
MRNKNGSNGRETIIGEYMSVCRKKGVWMSCTIEKEKRERQKKEEGEKRIYLSKRENLKVI